MSPGRDKCASVEPGLGRWPEALSHGFVYLPVNVPHHVVGAEASAWGFALLRQFSDDFKSLEMRLLIWTSMFRNSY